MKAERTFITTLLVQYVFYCLIWTLHAKFSKQENKNLEKHKSLVIHGGCVVRSFLVDENLYGYQTACFTPFAKVRRYLYERVHD